jgi:hypothetical protein
MGSPKRIYNEGFPSSSRVSHPPFELLTVATGFLNTDTDIDRDLLEVLHFDVCHQL